MKTLSIGSIQISFSSAVITVARDISHHDWFDEEGAYARQEIEISQREAFAVVIGLTGTARERGPHTVRVVSPNVFTRLDLAVHLESEHQESRHELLGAMFTTDYSWGQLVALNWSDLDWVPGGISHYLLPHEHPVITLGLLKLDWPSIEIKPNDRQ